MIKVIFFDLDGVLTTDITGGFTTCKFISQSENVDFDVLISCYKRFNEGANTGQFSFGDVWDDFCRCVDRKIDYGILKPAYESTPKNEKMFELARNLKKRFKIGIITYNNKDRFDILIKKFELNKLFDFLILSADFGALKTCDKLFKVAMDAASAKPGECIFIDNQKKNLEAPANIGMKTIFFDCNSNDVDLLEEEIKKLLAK